ncbi:MAG TPA: thiamine pyrophosphate-dependent enzyme [Bryobacteraceae bacterium]|nr:thiamine pyrophosphate-dependent enzyme [Bryobacteraceae bacterium]
MDKSEKPPFDRRGFLKGAAAGAAAFVAKPTVATAQQIRAAAPVANADEAGAPAPTVESRAIDRPGSDFMVDVLKSLGFEYACANPGASFAGLHESLINYSQNKDPEFITCMHEESSVAMAHGYAKIEGKPLLALAHGTVGLQHATMAIYNAWCDRVPVIIILGNSLNATERGGEIGWLHSVQDASSMVRDFTKWDDTPVSLQHFAESAVRAYKIAMTPPMAPVVLVADTELQEKAIPAGLDLRIPKLSLSTPPSGDSGAVAEAAKLLLAAENPLIVAGRAARTPQGLKLVIELAETLQAGVVDQYLRMNFPSRHPLNQSLRTRDGRVTSPAVYTDSDVILGLEVSDFYDTLRPVRQKKNVKLISINGGDLYIKSNYQNFQRYTEVDLSIAADSEATLPALIEACKRLITDDRKRAFEARGIKLAESSRKALEDTRVAASYGWDASPITTARVSAELGAQIKNEDWSLVSEALFFSNWPLRLWDVNKHYQYIGGKGGGGIGYGAPAALGAALANKKHGRLTVSIQTDGDLCYAPGILWTAAHHRIPLLSIMHNNRAYHQEIMGVQSLAARRNRGIDRAYIGTTISDPNIDFAKLAQGFGIHAEGPISDPKDLGPAIARAINVVKRGEPALVDVVTQPR